MTANCIQPGPINPFNQAIIDAFGGNFFPAYNTGGQPVDRKGMVDEKLLNLTFPGGGKIKPTGEPYETINKAISTVVGMIGPIFAGLGPFFIILDLIRGIIDVLCSLIDPAAIIRSMLELTLNIIPPVIGLFPAIAAVLIVINIIKVILAVTLALATAIIPIIELIFDCGRRITEDLAAGRFSAADGCSLKICQLLQLFLNEIGALAPLSFILDFMDIIMSLASKFFCAGDSECCDEDACPGIIRSPLSGNGFIAGVNGPNVVISTYTNLRVFEYKKYIVDPSNIIPRDGDGGSPGASIRLEINGNLYPVREVFPGIIFIETGAFTDDDKNTVIQWKFVPDKTQLLAFGLISISCSDDLLAASESLRNQVNGDSGFAFNRTALDSLRSKVGQFPRPDKLASDLTDIHGAMAADPTLDLTGDVNTVVTEYLTDLSNFYEDVVCAGASRTGSTFAATKQSATADGIDSTQLSLRIADRNGANLLDAQIPNSKFAVIFDASSGVVGPVVFDPVDSTFKASLTSTEPGRVSIKANFLVNNRLCMVPGIFNGVTLEDKVLEIDFITPAGIFKRKRVDRQYETSAGGRRRV